MKHVYIITWLKDMIICNKYKTARAAKKQIKIWCTKNNKEWRKQDLKVRKIRKDKLKKFYKNFEIEI